MRICVSVLPDDPSLLAPHFGDSSQYLIYDSENGQVTPHPAQTLPCRGPCRCSVPTYEGIDLVICRTIGHLVLRALKAKGIPVYQTQETAMMAAIAA